MKEEWLMPGAIVPVDPATTKALVDEIKRLIGVIGGMALQAELEATNRQVEILSDALAESRQEVAALKINAALDKKAENARELGLDYEPADGTQVSKVWWDGEKLMAKPIPLEDFYLPASGCTRSHPHENMDAMCELRTEIARLTNENARLKAQPAPVQEPVACVIDGDLYFHHEIDWEDLAYQGHGVELLYTTPPAQRPFVGLTDEEVLSEAKRFALGLAFPFNGITTPEMFARAIEAKLKERNV